MSQPVFTLQPVPDARYAALVWEVFFRERGRGLSLAQHFPWLGRDTRARYASLCQDGELLAGLAVKPVQGINAATIGLVCVRADRRGEGLSRQLLDQALTALDTQGLRTLTLWTGKPEVYRKQGFKEDHNAIVLHVEAWPQSLRRAVDAQSWPAGDDGRGLPAYALSAQRLLCSTGQAEAVVLTDPLGCAVAQWRGSDEAVVDLLTAAMPAQWRLHALAGDTLPAALSARGAQFHEQPGALQMWRDRPGQAEGERPRLRLLDRI